MFFSSDHRLVDFTRIAITFLKTSLEIEFFSAKTWSAKNKRAEKKEMTAVVNFSQTQGMLLLSMFWRLITN
jgi:hypothetical protein